MAQGMAVVKQDIFKNNGQLWWEEGRYVEVTDSFPHQIAVYTSGEHMTFNKNDRMFDELFEVIELGGCN